DAVAAGLGPAFVVGSPSAAGPHTRPGASHDIDHVVTRGAALRWLEVVDGGGLSDHNPVAAGVAAG
ncbi:MAG TPA: endonuclease/exonuclease/phosphatase family protein, partial [Myxococcota bacterium]|nr:endonuclease/exonuclease/phosphatase family protein [Myxococcota bacterium]